MPQAFAGLPVALRPTTTDGVWDVFFSRFVVAKVDLRDNEIHRQPVRDVSGLNRGLRPLAFGTGAAGFWACAAFIFGRQDAGHCPSSNWPLPVADFGFIKSSKADALRQRPRFFKNGF